MVGSAVAGATPEYTIAEARKHIGENATVVGMVTCIGNGRRHTDLEMGGCLPATLLWVVVPNDVSGPELDCWKLPGGTIAVTGKIESSEGTPQITIKSTTQIVRRTSLDPNYLISANEKENKRDLDGAIADLDRAIDLTDEPGVYMQRARLKENKGDLAGAIRDYDQMIERHAELDEAVRASYHDNRAKLKIRNRDFDGAIADATSAIQLNPRFPWHYATRGQANEGKGDFAAAIKDYKMAIQTEPHNSAYKDMLRHAQAGASQKHQQSFNKSEATPDSIAEAFVQAYSGADVDGVAGLYADRVDYTNNGVISNAAIRKQALEYFARWPVRHWSLVGPVSTVSLGTSKKKVIFSATYDASDPQTNKDASGIAKETLIVASDASGAMKIVSQKEQTSKRGSSQLGEETSEDPRLNAAKAEYGHSSHDEAARVRYVTKLADMELDAVVVEELRKHPMPRNVDSRKLTQLLIGNWDSPRHTYVFRADGTYGVSDEQRDKWRIDGNEYIDDVSRGPIILLDRNYFIYAEGQGAAVYIRAHEQSNSQPGEETSRDVGLTAAGAEHEQKTKFACKLVARGKQMELLSGYAQWHVENGGEILLGHVHTPASTTFGSPCAGVPWIAELGADGKLLWAARVEEQPGASGGNPGKKLQRTSEAIAIAPWYGLTTDGDHLWAAAGRGNGLVQLARFKAGTLEREASAQTGFQVTETAGVRVGPSFQFHSQTGSDFQMSAHQTSPESVKVVVFSRELRPVLDKIYTIPDRLAGRESEPLWGMNLIRLPDRTGYYMVVEPHLARGGKHGPRIGIIRLDNSGAVKWANTYPTGYSESGITPRVTKDGAILVSVATYSQPEPARSLLIKISPNGTVNWATTIEDIDISFGDFQFPCQSEPAPYRFTEPSLLALGIQRDDPQEGWWMIKGYSVLFRLNYETGKIEKQIKFGANTPGSCSFVEHDANSFYVGFANQQWLDKPTGHGSSPNRVKYHAAALRFDYDVNLLAACKIRDATSAATPVLHLFGSDNVVISYDGYEGKLMIEATNANLDSSDACRWLDKENFTFTNSNFQQHPAHVDSSPLTVTVSDGNSKISQADLTLAPLDLEVISCKDNQ